MLRNLAALLTRSGRQEDAARGDGAPRGAAGTFGARTFAAGTTAASTTGALTAGRPAVGAVRGADSGLIRLVVPAGLPLTLGCDAVGVPARYGLRLLARLPRNGCVYADSHWWWWIVPAGSDVGLTWPLPSHYARGARVPATSPRLVGRPDTSSAYTPPIPLYLMACQLTGTTPLWSAGVRTGRP